MTASVIEDWPVLKAPKPLVNPDEVRRAIHTLIKPGNVFEIRALEAMTVSLTNPRLLSGFFDDPEKAVRQLQRLHSATGIYITMQPVVADLLSIRCNRLDAARSDENTQDKHITWLNWLLIDCDPVRPSAHISSTDSELTAALERANRVQEFLAEHGFPEPVMAESGNGAHLLYRIDLPPLDAALLKRVLHAVAQACDDGRVAIDQTVFNPSRITKLYGTLACKGDDTPHRPHRLSRITSLPSPVVVVRREQLEAVAGLNSRPTPTTYSSATSNKYKNSGSGEFDVREFLQKHHIGIKGEHRKDKCQVIELTTCPFNADHGAHGEVAVFLGDNGKLGFKCHHSSCADKHWRDFRQFYEPDCYGGSITTAISAAVSEATPRGTDVRQAIGQSPGINADDDPLKTANADPRKKIRLPGPQRLLSEFAMELAECVADKDIYVRCGEIVVLSHGELHKLQPQELRTWVEQFLITYRVTPSKNSGLVDFSVTMHDDEARGVLASPQFASALRPVKQINNCRLPVLRSSNGIELLPWGYDAESQTLTVGDIKYATDMPLDEAQHVLDDLLAEFVFADATRSKSVAIASLVGLFGKHLLPRSSLRPCFIFVANAEGAGKTLLAAIAITPALGLLPTGCKSHEDEEVRKLLLTAVREGRAVVFLDNIKGRLSSAALEGFLSAPEWSDRKLGTNEMITGENLSTVIVTGNGLTVSPDMRRRSLFVELRLEVERAEDRRFNRPLDLPTLLNMRPRILAALWAVVRHWDETGRPSPSRSHFAFPLWARVVGGIVEAAGFGCPLEAATVSATADPDGEDMRALVDAMAVASKALSFWELVELARGRRAMELARGRTLPQGLLGQAIDYALKRWDALTRFVDDGVLEIDGNLIENSIRPSAIGKKNFLFFGHPEAGERSAVIYTLLGSCRRHGINPFDYLKDLFTRLPAARITEIGQFTPAQWGKMQSSRLAPAA